MGSATVEKLKTLGYTVFALDILSAQVHEGAIPVVADITDESSLQKAFDFISGITHELYAIIHFSGVYMLDSLVEIPEMRFMRAFDINVFGAYRVNRMFLPLLGKGSRIIITSSELAPLEPLPFTGLYAITKAALDKYAASLRMELQLLDISVSVLRPGAVKTKMLGVSTDELGAFSERSVLYRYNAEKFRQIVDRVESRNIDAKKIAGKVVRILESKCVRPVYAINRNPLLLLLNVLPVGAQNRIIKWILKEKSPTE